MILEQIKNEITPLDFEAKEKAKERLDSLMKPIGSLGRLEDLDIQLAGITGQLYPELNKKVLLVFSADNGIWEEGVSAPPQEVTKIQSDNFLKGISAISVLTRHAKADLKVVDIGVNNDCEHPGIIRKKIRYGTWNMAKGPAMTREEAIRGIEIGIDLIRQLKYEGYNIVGTGEMGIANTTTSSCVLISLTDCSIDEAVGKGGGITEEQLRHKKKIISRVLEINSPDPNDPIDVLAKVGGFDIAGLMGAYLGAAYYKLPIVIDGFISAVAALLAYKINPLVTEYMIPSHASKEPGFLKAMNIMGLQPILNLDMRLGEGSGCALVFNIVDAAGKIMKEMATFAEGDVDDSKYIDIDKEIS